MTEVPWWVEYWCKQNHWTEPCWVEDPLAVLGGRWWAFPPLAVMPVPIDPLGLDPVFGALDQVMLQFERNLDETFVVVERRVEPLIEQFDHTCRSLVKAWGLDEIFDD